MAEDKLLAKVARMHHAMGKALADPKVADVPVRRHDMPDGEVIVALSFADVPEEEIENLAGTLIAQIASLKDHLKAWCGHQSPKVPFRGDDLINSNLAVAIVHDLWNLDKHSELNTAPRSGRKVTFPQLTRVADVKGGFFFSAKTGFRFPEDATLTLIGRVCDEDGRSLGEFSAICAEAADAWEATLRDAGVPIDSA